MRPSSHELPLVHSQRSRACRQGKGGRGADAAATLLVAAALVTVPVNDLASPMANRALVLHLCECAVIDRRHRPTHLCRSGCGGDGLAGGSTEGRSGE
jgi:hypothetical protein